MINFHWLCIVWMPCNHNVNTCRIANTMDIIYYMHARKSLVGTACMQSSNNDVSTPFSCQCCLLYQ